MQQSNVFESIINNMVKDGFMDENEAVNLKDKYSNYIDNIRHVNNQRNENKSRTANIQNANKSPISVPMAKQISEPLPERIVNPISLNNIPKTPIQLKKEQTREQIKERNLSWILNIGVILILISGLIFATTTWNLFVNIDKVLLLFGVSLFFFVISIFAKHVLKINKSSNAFWVMGSLFLPLSLLSIGFFKLIGNYYSIFGGGRYIYGVFCCLICLPMFIFSTYKFKSRIFSWLTLCNISLLFAFTVASFYPPPLVLIFILFIFNALLLLMKQKVNTNRMLELFFKEMGTFIQFNLLIVLALTMTNFSTDILYPINLLMLSLIVFALSITEKQIIYDYLSALIFSAGICLLGYYIDNDSIQLILITSIGIIFSTTALLYKNEAAKYRRYSVISAIATSLSFLYIAAFSIPFMRSYDTLIFVGVACLVILIMNNLYLYLKSILTFVGFIIPPQIFILIYECLYIFNRLTGFNYKLEYLLGMTLLLFTFGYGFNKYNRLKNFAASCAICSLLSNITIFIWCFNQKGIFVSLPIISMVFALELLVLWLKINRVKIKLLLGYLLPFVTFVALCLIRYSYSLNSLPEYTYYFGCAFIVYCLHFATAGRLQLLKASFFYCGHILLAIEFSILLLTHQKQPIQIVSILLMFTIYLYSIYHHRKNKVAYLWLNLLLITFTLLLFKMAHIINIYAEIDLYKYVFYANGFLVMLVFNLIKKNGYRRNISIYLSLITVILILGNMFTTNILWYEYCAELLYCALMCLILTKSNLQSILFIPLLLYVSATYILIQYVLKSSLLSFAIILLGAVILVTIGRRRSRFIVSNEYIDFYNITALVSIFLLQYHYDAIGLKTMGTIIPAVLGSLWFLVNRNRISEGRARLGNTLFVLSLLWPYYSLLSTIQLLDDLIFEAYLLPLVVLCYICVKWIHKDKNLKLIEYIIPILCYILIMSHLIVSDSIIEAMIIGWFSFFLILYGSIFKTKSALFTGGILMILTVVIKSKEFWLSIQWWTYLAVIGVTLVIIASINEFQKNKSSEGILPKVNKILEKFSDWD